MEVICINIDNLPISIRLTCGKWYKVLDTTSSVILMECDDTQKHWIFKDHFKTLSEIRDEKLNKLGI